MRSDRTIATGIVDLNIDLTIDSDNDEETSQRRTMTSSSLQPKVPHSSSSRPMNAHAHPAKTASPRVSHVPLPVSASRNPSTNNSLRQQARNSPYGATPPSSSSGPPSASSSAGPRPGSGFQKSHVPLPSNMYDGANDADAFGPSGKRRKLSGQAKQSQVPVPKSSTWTGASEFGALDKGHSYGNGISAFRRGAQSGPTPSRLSTMSSSSSVSNKLPSVQYMNAALKSSGTTSSLVSQVASDGPRPLQIGRMPGGSGFNLPSPSLTSTSTTPTTTSPLPHNATHALQSPNSPQARQDVQTTALRNGQIRPRATRTGTHLLHSKPNFQMFSTARPLPTDDDKDIVMSDTSHSASYVKQRAPAEDNIAVRQPPTVPTPKTTASRSTKAPTPKPTASRCTKAPSQFSEVEEHLLVFLKEVKKFPWALITEWFNKDFPGKRPYHTLQSRYTTKTNRRDRSQDPATLNLPSRWASEAVIDWAAVHANNPGPRDRVQLANLYRDAGISHAPRTVAPLQTTEQDYSSGTDSGVRRQRTRRGPPVNYDVRKRTRHQQSDAEDEDAGVRYSVLATPYRSESPSQAQAAIPGKALVVINEPLKLKFAADDADIGLLVRAKTRSGSPNELPYLKQSLRSSLQNPPNGWDWDQLSSRAWQGSLLHVDFGPTELKHVQRVIFRVLNTSSSYQHSTRRRQLRNLLKNVSDPMRLRLADALQRTLPNRDSHSIDAFLEDARAGTIADDPQILRLCAARPEKATSSIHTASTSSMLRHREFGTHSRRGWQTATTALSYQTRNKVMDTLGPSLSWIGASSDIHTVAWSPDGERYAAGAVAVTDSDSMQYNRPNNLLFGNVLDPSIHELAEHSTERERTESGANSSHAMFVSQDRDLYSTVTSVAFAPSGRLMYSAGYDESLCVWELGEVPSQPRLAAKLRHKGKVEMMDVNSHCEGLLATAAQRSSGASIKIVKLNEEDPSQFDKLNFHSEKASSRADLHILPQALRFEPRYGAHLLAGFGANVRNDNGFDLTGDLCLWDIETQDQIAINGSNRNVFDVAFNPNRRYMPQFAAGCVANGNVNRGTRSVIRLYEPGLPKYTCPLEIECRALDMNDVVWCPQDEHLIAAGCTDGRVYVWDMRSPDDPLMTLSHGHSLIPLQDGVHHERTDTGIRFLSWGDNATRLYSGSSDGVLKVWDVTRSVEDTFIKDLVTLDTGIMAGAFSPDYSKLVLGEVNGSVNVLDVGRDDCSMKDAEKLRFVPYAGHATDGDSIPGSLDASLTTDSGFLEGQHLLQTQQLQVISMGSLPIKQVVQGPAYQGPYDRSIDALFLREQALEFQLSMAKSSGPQCTITACKDSIVTVTSEEIGDSGRSKDRIPDELHRQWIAIDNGTQIMPGKARCMHCSRVALPSTSDDADAPVLCERCSFACFRCGSTNPIAPGTTTLICDACTGVWEIGALGYECVQQPIENGVKLDVPSLRRYGRDRLVERFEDRNTSFGDEMNALTEYYFSLAIDRPESPPL